MVVGMCPVVPLETLPAKTIHLAPGRCVARIAAANEVPEAVPSPELAKELAENPRKGDLQAYH